MEGYQFEEDGVEQSWELRSVRDSFCWGYVLFNSLIARLKKLDNEDEVAAEWGKVADGLSSHNHGVGIIVSKDLSARIIDNGCTHGMKLFTMVNLADRLDDVTTCFKFELFEV